MAASYPRQIPPGGTGEIILKVKTDGDAGKTIRERAAVYTDDPDNAIIELTLTGEIIPPAQLTPQTARLMGPAGFPIHTEIKITPAAINPFTIKAAKAVDGRQITFHLEKKSDAGAPHFILRVSNTRKDPGRYSDKIILTTTSAISPEITVRVFGVIRESAEKEADVPGSPAE